MRQLLKLPWTVAVHQSIQPQVVFPAQQLSNVIVISSLPPGQGRIWLVGGQEGTETLSHHVTSASRSHSLAEPEGSAASDAPEVPGRLLQQVSTPDLPLLNLLGLELQVDIDWSPLKDTLYLKLDQVREMVCHQEA